MNFLSLTYYKIHVCGISVLNVNICKNCFKSFLVISYHTKSPWELQNVLENDTWL